MNTTIENSQPFNKVCVVGAGAWGTALANLCAHNGVNTTIWARENDVAATINTDHVNKTYLPGAPLHPALKATTDLNEACGADAILFVIPVQFARKIAEELEQCLPASMPIALCSKGIERGTNLLLTEVCRAVWPSANLAVLSGPSFAKDVALGLPTAVTLACADDALGLRWASTIGAPHFRPYLSKDLIGAELGGAVKNVLAIAAGAVEGRGLGESARAAVIARGFAELQRLATALSAAPETMGGLCGLGDLILTATSSQSRNMSLGMALGQGQKLEDILGARSSVSEGVATAAGVVALANRAGVDAPISQAVADLVSGKSTIDEIISALLARPIRTEIE